MLLTSPIERLSLPAPTVGPPRSGFPWVATAAPVVLSVGIWLVTGSIFSLLFAALGPVVALGSVLDARRQRRAAVRLDRVTASVAVDALRERIDEIHHRERQRLEQLAPALATAVEARRVAAHWADEPASGAPLPVRVGLSDLDAVVELTVAASAASARTERGDDEIAAAVGSLRRTAARLRDAPVLVDARDGVAIVGPPFAARAVARSVVLQLLAQLSPASTSLEAPVGEVWAGALPHAVRAGGAWFTMAATIRS